MILGVIFGGFNIGMAAFTGAVLLSLLRAADDGEAIKRMPWGTILMVCGVTVLIGLLQKTGGMEIFSNLLSSIATQATVDPGARRRHRRRLGVLEHVGRRAARVPADGARASSRTWAAAMRSAIASTMNIAGHLVDVSPLSTIGALCIASVPVRRHEPQAVQSALGVGHEHDARRRRHLLDPVRLALGILLAATRRPLDSL